MKKEMINGYEVGKLLANLHKISKDLNKPIDAPEVLYEYQNKFGGLKENMCKFVTFPIYFPPECSSGEEPIYPDDI